MNENINLCEILKDCPKGEKFYSSVYGELLYSHMYINSSASVIYFKNFNYLSLVDGRPTEVAYKRNGFLYNNGECTIFLSKNQRDWNKFKASWLNKPKFDPRTLKPFDRVLIKYIDQEWTCGIYSHYKNPNVYPYKLVIPYNVETQHLVGTKDEAPEYYRYWED